MRTRTTVLMLTGWALAGVLAWRGAAPPTPPPAPATATPGCAADLTRDGEIGVGDLLEVLGAWGPCFMDADGDGFDASVDCDDTDQDINPGMPEICNDGNDNDCNGLVDECADNDEDGFPASVDCDDNDQDVNPGMPEICDDGNDNDCDGLVDECADDDGDGFPASVDCDDNDQDVTPAADEVCDGTDNDCDGDVDEGC